MASKTSKADLIKNLTWDDLQVWAGGRVLSRGQELPAIGRVKELAQTQNGGLIAWVHGGQRYATQVDFKDRDLISGCTCPYGSTCKHAVAVVLEYLDHLKKNKKVPQITKDDQRLLLLKGITDEDEREDDQDLENDEKVNADYRVSKEKGEINGECLKRLSGGADQRTTYCAFWRTLQGSIQLSAKISRIGSDLSKGVGEEIGGRCAEGGPRVKCRARLEKLLE